MLSNLDFHTMIPAKELARAKEFYRGKLGMTQVADSHGAFMFTGPHGGKFFLFTSPLAGTAKGALMGWTTPDIMAEVSQLKSQGVIFDEYDLPNFKTIDSIVTAPTGRSAWFRDSEGNMLGLVQWN